MEAKDWLKGI
jgi:hypothetical protein